MGTDMSDYLNEEVEEMKKPSELSQVVFAVPCEPIAEWVEEEDKDDEEEEKILAAKYNLHLRK